MKSRATTSGSQMAKLVRFLEEHPAFSPALMGEDAEVYGFRVGKCFLTVHEMVRLIDTQVHFDEREEALLRIPPPTTSDRRQP